MSFRDLNQIQDEEFNTSDIGRGFEFWTNGKVARFGFNVVNGKCVEISLVEIDDFCSVIKSCETDAYRFNGRNGENKYLIENDHPSVHIYHNQTHVMSFQDYEKYPLPTIRKKFREEKIDWDVEDTAENVMDQYVGFNDELDVTKSSGSVADVEVSTEFLTLDQLLRLCSVEGIFNKYKPEDLRIESEEEFVNHVQRYLENVNVHVNKDGSVVYNLKIETNSY